MPIFATRAAREGPLDRGRILLIVALLVSIIPIQACASTVTVTSKLDYPLLRQLLIKQLFTTPPESIEILHDPSGCSRIELSNPSVAGQPPNLEIAAKVEARIGVRVLGGCTDLLQWEGNAGFLGQPVIDPGATSVRFEPVDSWLLAADGGRITSGRIWTFTKGHIQSRFGRFTLDLKPSIDNLGTMLRDVLPHRSASQLQTIVNSLQLNDLQAAANSLDVSLSFQVEELAQQPRPEAALSPEELQQWDVRWQMMDAFLTFAVKHYAASTSFRELHDALLEVLLDSRYRLRDALTAPARHKDDPLRRWFLDSWNRLSPIIRGISLEQDGQEPLLWISLLTATDALAALDRIGPAIGLDISAAGLRRLARLIDANADIDPLRYEQAIDPELQQLLRLPAPPQPDQPSGFRFDFWPIRSAWAGTSTDLLDRWVPGKDQLPEYLPLVAGLLKTTAEETHQVYQLEPQFAALFQTLVLATAWQESCWRQYVIDAKKITPLRSDSGDVGLMQINEKIWRGFYDIQKLRWDIAYNVRAGTEILLNYLIKYAVKQGEHQRSGGIDNLARASYSAYNGGPSQFSRYRNAAAASTHKRVDAAFWKKYQQVKAGKELHVAHCLGLEISDIAAVHPTATTARTGVNSNEQHAVTGDAGERWVLAQNENHYTLQLAVFSQRESARQFIARQSLPGPIRIYPVHRNQSTQFAVLYGSFTVRKDADREQRRIKQLKPWVRQFADLRKAVKPETAR